jgi:hypothetical protein
MKLSEIKNILPSLSALKFKQENGTSVPAHFHVTEVGLINKKFIDCGGTLRDEQVVNFQLWSASDTDHRLEPQKLLNIIGLSEKVLNIPDLEIEVEYQSDTIGKFGLKFNGDEFILENKQTACLAQDACGIEKPTVRLSSLTKSNDQACVPGGGCC